MARASREACSNPSPLATPIVLIANANYVGVGLKYQGLKALSLSLSGPSIASASSSS